MEKAIFAGGCFWCMVQPFDQHPGIISITSGYTGGTTVNPTYEEVCLGITGHTEAVEIIFDPKKISYDELVSIYWQQTDPTDAFSQFEDRGSSYRPIIFYHSEAQKRTALKSKQALNESGRFNKEVVTAIEPASEFYPAEDYHQKFYKKNPSRFDLSHQKRQTFINDNWKE